MLVPAGNRAMTMRRREFVAGTALLAAISRAAAKQDTKLRRLAIFSPSQSTADMQETGGNRYTRAAFAELRRLGHVEGENLTVERYGKEQNTAGLDALVAEVVRSSPDVVLSIGPEFAVLKGATTTIPIVAWTGDPITLGLVHGLAHPGGNITGVSVEVGPEIWGKRIGLLRDVFPAMVKLAFLGPLTSAWQKFRGPAIRAAYEAARLPLITALYELPPSASGYREAIAAAARAGADAIMVTDTPDAFENRVSITDLIGRMGLPAIYAIREFVGIGGLLAYGVDFVELSKRAADDIDAILRGNKPGDIPFYQATKFDLSVNLKTAKALGLTVPQLLLAQADKVIE
jgi:putative ABC transport system substrate-binding protein